MAVYHLEAKEINRGTGRSAVAAAAYMYDSKRDVSEMLGEETEVRSIRERLRKKQQTKTQRQKKPKHHEQER